MNLVSLLIFLQIAIVLAKDQIFTNEKSILKRKRDRRNQLNDNKFGPSRQTNLFLKSNAIEKNLGLIRSNSDSKLLETIRNKEVPIKLRYKNKAATESIIAEQEKAITKLKEEASQSRKYKYGQGTKEENINYIDISEDDDVLNLKNINASSLEPFSKKEEPTLRIKSETGDERTYVITPEEAKYFIKLKEEAGQPGKPENAQITLDKKGHEYFAVLENNKMKTLPLKRA